MPTQKNIREQREDWEALFLASNATLSANSRGRLVPLPPCSVRTEFMRDRDRILHCKAFRRLKHKTQVFLAPTGDHYRTRLTHTLEVSQIARTLARALRLNEDLAEAIALGHDLGHTPFGHAGEEELSDCMRRAGIDEGFSHNRQSLRVVEVLERDGQGLNLTFEVRDGILHHKKDGTAATPEGRVVSISDRIAYLNHDIDDAQRAGILGADEVPQIYREAFGNEQGERINNMVLRLLDHCAQSGDIAFAPADAALFNGLRDYMFEAVYHNPKAKREEGKARGVISGLYAYYLANPDEIPPDTRRNLEKDGLPRCVADHVSGMTDLYAIETFRRIFVPQSWNS
ncbi:MAG: deoxyguanosinetriphosphate triphosphohydrolase [Clostridiales bacterium]|nr:deoxyguanosinetriphosphate triphosphohydrolase [Clostridiales bacterium]